VLCTVIYDAYKTTERAEVHEALSTLLSSGQRDWSPEGVYAYWDRTTHDILYLGLASELPTRFAQHNGLTSHGGGNKTKEINRHFASNERLGFTILIQSKAIGLMEQIQTLDPTMGATAARTIAVGEGQLIEMHRLLHGRRPAWNRTGGSRGGKRYATRAPALLDLLAARRESLFAARHSLRVTTGSFRLRLFEATIHASRMRAMMEAHGMTTVPKDGDVIDQARIERSFMFRDGRLVEDLDASDTDIRRWLELLGDPEHWREEAAAWRGVLQRTPGSTPAPHEQAVFALLDLVVSQAAPPEHILATRDILDSGYLDEPVAIP
jgi:hypothetical protein